MKKTLMSALSLAALIFAADCAHAHGDDRLGPNKGYVQMPGAFHTELVLDKDQGVRIYLLDMDFKNATVNDSSVELTYRDGKKTVPFKCAAMGADHFHCLTSQKFSLHKGEFVVEATREKAVGNEARYKLPLKLSQAPAHH